MKVKLLPPLVLIVALGVGASVVARARDAAPPQPVYTATVVARGLQHNHTVWTGRTVLVQGDLHVTGGATPVSMPLVVLTTPSPPHVAIGPFDLTPFLQRLDKQGTQGQGDGLLLTQAQGSHQRLDFSHTRTYRLRLSLTRVGVYRNVPSGEIV